jgi:hypothetical protein
LPEAKYAHKVQPSKEIVKPLVHYNLPLPHPLKGALGAVIIEYGVLKKVHFVFNNQKHAIRYRWALKFAFRGWGKKLAYK